MEKAELRREIAARTRAMPHSKRRRLDAAIGRRILGFPPFRQAEQVLAYVALADEVSLDAVLQSAVLDGKRIFLPVMSPGGGLEFRSWLPGQELREARLGVLEPIDGEAPGESRSICLIPGRAFDSRGRRLGRGRGHYDRVLERLGRLGPTVGVAYGCQVVAEVPSELHDRRVEFVVTEGGIVASASEPGDSDGEKR